MKKIIRAWIEQVVEFDSKLEYLAYIEELKQSGKKFKVIDSLQDDAGKFTICVKKQYNNNKFPEN